MCSHGTDGHDHGAPPPAPATTASRTLSEPRRLLGKKSPPCTRSNWSISSHGTTGESQPVGIRDGLELSCHAWRALLTRHTTQVVASWRLLQRATRQTLRLGRTRHHRALYFSRRRLTPTRSTTRRPAKPLAPRERRTGSAASSSCPRPSVTMASTSSFTGTAIMRRPCGLPTASRFRPPDQDKYFKLPKAEVVVVNLPARMLHMDFTIISDAAMELAEDTCEQPEALNVAGRILDTCWLWPWAETKRKCDPMDRYPELKRRRSRSFKWFKEIYPYGWERAKAKVKSGQFHSIGGSWVEHDTTLPCGKSLVRQFLYGQRFSRPSLASARQHSNHKSLDQDNTALMAFGKGDGRGGPTWQHLERMRRLRGVKYRKEELDEMWQGVLLCQFHDCLPGTAFEMCYDDSEKETGVVLLQQIVTVLGVARMLPSISEVSTRCHGRTSFDDAKAVTVEEITPGLFQLQNAHLTVTVKNGTITSIYDRRARRETLAGKANQYAVSDDKPIYWQAWDAEVYHLDTRKEPSNSNTTIHEDKGHRASVVTETRISENSSIRTIISLTSVLDEQPSLIECTADVDWHETMKFLKVEFPVKISNTEASYETQYGVIKRPTHYNTSYFEVCCHKFADLSEHKYGISIPNDSKYGFSTVGNVMCLSLLRSPKAPDGNADMGRHRIRWAMIPHRGGLGAQTVRAAFNFNNPLRLVATPKGRPNVLPNAPIALTGDHNLVLDWIKRGEDDEDVSLDDLPKRKSKSVVVRVYDATNILEGDLEEVTSEGGSFDTSLELFEIATHRFLLKD
ncbi:alpha-mannosidase [Verticillium dahliae VdLs.17]|uniref:Alpha-mannosidase n=1 Tax=Verticillium dahliae (strain VdLs.17 / ATCC MYA-4575 / FGSC 10137) TaxID=498257 RepID=G2XA92_VERDV|nr:alpha-mannosidase [Verticillium dahliae VdLs.17]EGY15831.1 alpha-mannosidase [Verticillium dahliae VdLs.17]KAH6702284.1 alpha-mannosidase [Verticillium dahliae]